MIVAVSARLFIFVDFCTEFQDNIYFTYKLVFFLVYKSIRFINIVGLSELCNIYYVCVFSLSSDLGYSSSCSNIHCHSINMAFKRCPMKAAIEITSANVIVKYSVSKCSKNWSYGIDSGGKSIWVTRGCRALFKVCASMCTYSTTVDSRYLEVEGTL